MNRQFAPYGAGKDSKLAKAARERACLTGRDSFARSGAPGESAWQSMRELLPQNQRKMRFV